MRILQSPTLVTVNILYYRPMFVHLVQQFVWQTDDTIPEYPRVKKFLHFWKDEIDAIIKEVTIANGKADFHHIDLEKFW